MNQPSRRLGRQSLDEDLLVRIGKDDMEAFGRLYEQTEKIIYAYALSLMKNHHDALDVVQETFLKVRGAAHLYVPQGKPLAWMMTIARNQALSKIRLNQRFDGRPLEDLGDDEAFAYLNNPEDRIVLKQVLEILDETEREIVLLHAAAGVKHIEIAAALGMPLSTVISKYNRSLKKLRKKLEETGEEHNVQK